MPRTLRVDPLSLCSLHVTVKARDQPLSTATGFVVEHADRPFLITNWHVVSGRHSESNKLLSSTGAVPDEIEMLHRGVNGLNYTVSVRMPLYNPDGEPRWLCHPRGQQIDVVALPLHYWPEVAFYPIRLQWAEQDVLLEPGIAVSIIGYPYGLTASGIFPIWKTGHIASDPDLDYDALPAFLIDATTRGGMSGSPVIYKLVNNYRNRSEEVMFLTTPGQVFCGVYSGRIRPESEIGRVWRPQVIAEILARVF